MKQAHELGTGQSGATADGEWVARARGIAPLIESQADRIESEKRVPDDVMSAMHDAKLFRMCLPRTLGFHTVKHIGFVFAGQIRAFNSHIHDLNATILHLLGIDHERLTYRFQGRHYRLTDVHGKVVKGVLA